MIEDFSRVEFINDFNFMGRTLRAGTIGTKRATIADDLALVQVGYLHEDEKPSYVGVSLSAIKKIKDKKKLNNIKHPHDLIPKLYHIGNKWRMDDNIYKISKVSLAVNEENDLFFLTSDGSTKDIDGEGIYVTKKLLDKNYSHVPIVIEDELNDNVDDKEIDSEDNTIIKDIIVDKSNISTNNNVEIFVENSGNIIVQNLNVDNIDLAIKDLKRINTLITVLKKTKRGD